MLLVAVDIEGCASEVVAVAGQLALDLGLPLTLLTAAEVPGGVPDSTVRPGAHESVHDEVLQAADRALRELAQPWADQGVPVTTSVPFGAPDRVVLEAARTLKPRFVVLGTHGRTGLSRWMFGSVEEAITRRCTVPVVVVPSPDTTVHATSTLASLRAEADG
jgi:nucleotide-binding universal stress UspA family protein